ncbi:cationic amino acid transporter 3 isoform X3 [Hermetia illucens]|nr:cationic amino acid transporter 3 isoform X3 [Hermetia illucens]XP_037908529.1 cationic amino acid transporter 3 isoform X3 [Hermetia illucens]XP_037908531.1 cationic amino acid transporter 3 isoform X3 [Hermetia illucens]XP_037908532.1 cationic amino acid transporter 3 isoform X3 [Hermetia illucens]XP_037908533.1 cationic amino acid transporter 3 isoform X3 [Hermetia illucens]
MDLWKALTRTKRNAADGETKLARVLGIVDLVALGVGSTLGLGVYVLAGAVAHDQAGPAVVISFLIAAVASAFSGLCYAEFAARVPKAGSAYVYSYVTVGEFVAFTIGWNLILEYVIGTSSVARGLSGYLDSLLNNTMSTALREAMPMDVDFLAEYPDFFSFGMILILTAILAYGVKESSFLNKIFTAVNLVTIAIVLVAGGIKSDPKNWNLPKEGLPSGAGEGGFMPFGIAGVMAGAAKCFYGFVGFDCVATTGEEAKNPQRNIPLSIVISLIIIFLAYFGVSTVLTMMWPYYDQNPDAPFPYVFDQIGWIEIKWIVTIGAIFALCTSLLGAMFPLPRVLYAMANDGIIYKFLKTIHPFTKTPLKATILSGLLAAVMALIFNLHQLIDMMSIGTLLAYTIVAVCVLVLRYQDNGVKTQEIDVAFPTVLRQLFNLNFIKHPNSLTSGITKVGIVVFAVLGAVIFGIMSATEVSTDNVWTIVVITILAAGILLILLMISRQPVADEKLTFKVPLVPYIPCLSALMNLYLMFQLDVFTWIRFVVWIIVGYIIYFTYGIRKSVERKQRKEEKKAMEFNGVKGSEMSTGEKPDPSSNS